MLKRKFFGALTCTSESRRLQRETTESDVRAHYLNQISNSEVLCEEKQLDSSQRNFLSLKESRKTEKNGSWSFECSKTEGEILVLKYLKHFKQTNNTSCDILQSPRISFSKWDHSFAPFKSSRHTLWWWIKSATISGLPSELLCLIACHKEASWTFYTFKNFNSIKMKIFLLGHHFFWQTESKMHFISL